MFWCAVSLYAMMFRAVSLIALCQQQFIMPARARPPPPNVPIDFVPEFSFTVRVVEMQPPPADATKVSTLFEWGWGQAAGEVRGYATSSLQNFTRAKTGTKWAGSYPNTYGLKPQYQLDRWGGDDQVLVTHLFVCHIGTEPSHNVSLRPPNQTTTVEMNLTLGGKTLTLGGTLEWGGEEGYCDDLGIVVGKHKSSGAHFVETFREFNARKYCESMAHRRRRHRAGCHTARARPS